MLNDLVLKAKRCVIVIQWHTNIGFLSRLCNEVLPPTRIDGCTNKSPELLTPQEAVQLEAAEIGIASQARMACKILAGRQPRSPSELLSRAIFAGSLYRSTMYRMLTFQHLWFYNATPDFVSIVEEDSVEVHFQDIFGDNCIGSLCSLFGRLVLESS